MARFQTPQRVLRVDFVCKLAFHQDVFGRPLLQRHTHATGLKTDGHLRAQRERVQADEEKQQWLDEVEFILRGISIDPFERLRN